MGLYQFWLMHPMNIAMNSFLNEYIHVHNEALGTHMQSIEHRKLWSVSLICSVNKHDTRLNKVG